MIPGYKRGTRKNKEEVSAEVRFGPVNRMACGYKCGQLLNPKLHFKTKLYSDPAPRAPHPAPRALRPAPCVPCAPRQTFCHNLEKRSVGWSYFLPQNATLTGDGAQGTQRDRIVACIRWLRCHRLSIKFFEQEEFMDARYKQIVHKPMTLKQAMVR